MKILQTVKKIPGGLMVVPLLLGAVVNTFFPIVWTWFDGTFTTHLWKSGAMPILAVFLFCNGATINFKKAGVPLAKGFIITVVKVVIGIVIGLLVNSIFGPAGVLGLTPLAIVGALANSNGGLYASLAGEYGDNTDVGAVAILSINDGPFFTMLALGASGIASIPINALNCLKNATIDARRAEVAQMACKAAVKGGDPLSAGEIESLIRQLLDTGAPPTCPHGRPVMKVISRRELEKMFKRIH